MNKTDELATLIAELGQEVGAVLPVGYMDPDADFMLPRKGQCVLSSHVVLVRDPHGKYTRPIYLSPAHTSEARDWEGVEHVASHIENAVEYITKQYPDARMLDRAPIMRNMRRWARNLRAAMRQEGGK